MCLECLNRICCGNVNLTQREIQLTSNFNEISKKFLAKRKTILGFLSIWYSLIIINDIYSMIEIISDINSAIDVANNNTVIILLRILEGLISYLFAYDVVALMLIIVMYYFWNNYKLNSKLSLILWFIINSMPIILLYVPIRAIINNYVDNYWIALGLFTLIAGELFFYIITNMLIPALSMIQIFLLKTNSLFREFDKTYEYKIISTVLTMIYIPVYLVVLSVLFQLINDYWVYGFVISYTLFLVIPLITTHNYYRYVSWIFGLSAIIILGYLMWTYFGYNIYIPFITGYIRSLLIDLLITDFLNSTIMNNKSIELDSKFNILMKDFGYITEDRIQLTTIETVDIH